MDPAATVISVLFGLFGAGLGLFALVSPEKAAKLVRLQPDADRPEGVSEIRAVLGGVFLFLHLAFLIASFLGSGVIGAAAVLSFGWGGAAAGRILSLILDGETVRTRHNYMSTAIELAAALAFALPVLNYLNSAAA